ncbi:MAG: DUF192 domain-containing protein [Candidatus Omnitrophota bacterium]
MVWRQKFRLIYPLFFAAVLVKSFANLGLELIPCYPEAEAHLGLQYVIGLPENTGLIFKEPAGIEFHTHNCRFPIEWSCFSGKFELLKRKVLLPETSGHITPAGTRYVIETNKGFFARKGIKEGDRFDPKSIRYSRKYKTVYDLPRIKDRGGKR